MSKGKDKSSKKGKKTILLCGMLLTAVAILPTTVIIFIGMLPTIVVRLADRTAEKSRVLTIGFMNFAGCFPIWFQMLQAGHKFDIALTYIANPFNIVIMYGAALVGYIIEWGLSGLVAGIMVQRGHKRLEDIKKAQGEIIERWGREVSGEIPLDIYGFPIEQKEK
jgi:hypothetical protein